MKKFGLLSIIGCSVSGAAIAAGVDCSVIPTCAELGYTKIAADCEGKVMLRCPFDITNDNAVFCADGELCSDEYNLDACPENGSCEECGGKYHLVSCNDEYIEKNGTCTRPTGIGCTSIGSILYNDLNCYTSTSSDKTAIGVVFDTTNKLAIGLAQGSTMLWWNSYEDISNLENCTDSNTVKTTCGTSGKTNSAALVAAGYTNADYAVGYCYNQTIGGLTKGDWFLPSAKELQTIYNNKSTINNAITNADGTIIGTGSHWSSTEYGTHSAWWLFELDGNGDLSSASKGNGGNVRCAVAY